MFIMLKLFLCLLDGVVAVVGAAGLAFGVAGDVSGGG